MSFQATPITVLTGFLGSGKTTLLNQLLAQNNAPRFAVIENEFGEIGIDADLITSNSNETIIQLANGCICCTVRGDLANALASLVEERKAGKIDFDHVLIETTGLADPGPITRTFLAETAVLDHFYLDGVVTVVDAVHGMKALDRNREARTQIAYADRILITKTDSADKQTVKALRFSLQGMNITAQIEELDLTDVLPTNVADDLLNIKGYQFDRAPTADLTIGDEEEHRAHNHLDKVVSICWETEKGIDSQLFDAAMAKVTSDYPETLWRVKGVLNVKGVRQRLVVQGVNGLLQINPTTVWRPFEPRKSRLILIGEGLDREGITGLLNDACFI